MTLCTATSNQQHDKPLTNQVFLQIYISSSLANLYEGVKKKDWRLTYTGVPVLMYDKGSAKSRSSPRVTFVLAERGTCFALWKDTIDNLSNYKVSGAAFHTMCLSSGENLFYLPFVSTEEKPSWNCF